MCFTLRTIHKRLWKSSRHASDEIVFFLFFFPFFFLSVFHMRWLLVAVVVLVSPLPSFVRIAFWCDFIYVFILSLSFLRVFLTLFSVYNGRARKPTNVFFSSFFSTLNLGFALHCIIHIYCSRSYTRITPLNELIAGRRSYGQMQWFSFQRSEENKTYTLTNTISKEHNKGKKKTKHNK